MKRRKSWEATVLGCVQGADHIDDDQPCQDAASVREGIFRAEPYLICTLADGHGHKQHAFSDRGAMLALLAAEQTWIQFMLNQNRKNSLRKKSFEQHIQANLKAHWIEMIRHQLRLYRVADGLVRKYGTTLLSVLIYRNRIYIAQLGDGTVCMLDSEGNAHFVVEPEFGPIENATDSLCCDDAEERWNFISIPADRIKTLMLSSDGLINCFPRAENYAALTGIIDAKLRESRAETVQEIVTGWLEHYSEKSSGDDISVITVAMNQEEQNKGEL